MGIITVLNLIFLLIQFSTIQPILSSPISIKTPEAPSKTTPNPLKRGPSNGWWTETVSIVCLPPTGVITRWIDRTYPSDVGPLHPGEFDAFNRVLSTRPPGQAVRLIESYISDCQQCECFRLDTNTDKNGIPILRPPPISPETTTCQDQEKANSCIYLFGCTCEFLVSTKDDPSLAAGSAFDVLNKPFVPKEVFHKTHTPSNSRSSFSNPMDIGSIVNEYRSRSYRGALEPPRDRWLVPGTKEPYWVEGPESYRVSGRTAWK
ncbi:hypothetical protein TWF718_006901 [Orbilia javanica]|uniref:Uncharacterized protein n=1 Tax=Orbilia javanica TaxID=47235 RepID=A0AAN8RDF8_9PEZI